MSYNPICYIGYSFPPVYTGERDAHLKRIDEVIKSTFNEHASIASHPEDINGNEVIYKIERPLFDSQKEETYFFRSLKAVFDDTADLHPYFCTFKEVNHGR